MRILDILLEQGHITAEQKSTALEIVAQKNREDPRATVSPLTILLNKHIISELDIHRAFALYYNVEFIESIYTVDPSLEALRMIPEDYAKRWTVLPLSFDPETGELVVLSLVNKIRDSNQADDIRLTSGGQVRRVTYKVATKESIELGIGRFYRADAEMERIAIAATPPAETKSETITEEIEVEEESEVVKFVNLVLHQAVSDKASDIHIEQDEKFVRVRFRIDGVLHDVNQTPKSMGAEIVSRLKVIADLDIAKRQLPQDGRISYHHKDAGKIDLRVATLPTVHGEKVVMRILDNSSASMELAELGFSDYNLERFRSAYSKPYGAILVTGPTGSGKSTTLYASLNEIISPEINIITVEDPVEYRIPRINQIAVNARVGLTFAATLRTVLRADPDVILVGEIRDGETAGIAITAAQTGHLVFSTLHTNDAASAAVRLAEMGVQPYLVGSVTEAILAQRLIRKLCNACKEDYTPEADVLKAIDFPWKESEPLPTLSRAKGCAECANTGYQGRMAVHEVLLVDPDIEKLIVEKATSVEIEKLAIEKGMRTMKQDGFARVLQRKSSIEEIFRVVA